MNLSEIWIRRPVMTLLVMAAVLLFGLISYRALPINNLPNVDFPTISVTAVLPGASPAVMAATVAMPLEKKFSVLSGIDSMTSTSQLGVTNINIQFSLERNIDAAALDVNSAIAAAMGVLPRNLPNPPTYKKVNPADMPIMMLALTSDTLPVTRLQDWAENVLIAHLSGINGVAEVDAVPVQRYAVRVQVDPFRLAALGVGINEVSDALQNGNVNLPGGTLDGGVISYTVESNGQLFDARSFSSLIVTSREGRPVRVSDVARVLDGVENDRASADYLNQGRIQATVCIRVTKQPGSNTVEITDRIRKKLPDLQAMLPSAAGLDVFYDQSDYIRESIRDVEFTLILTIALVVFVIFLFIRAGKPTLIPSLVVPLSIIGTYAVMALLNYSLNTLSLMAITLSIGFVVDDAIVVMENIIRRIESGENAVEASLKGSREIGFTILSMTVSLAVVFIPILFMGGILGRLFREFAVAITVAILFSGFFSLTLTPMLCSRLLDGLTEKRHGRVYRLGERFLDGWRNLYGWTLRLVLKGKLLALVFTGIVVVVMFQVLGLIPKGFVPNQDQYFFRVFCQGSDRTSYADMRRHMDTLNRIILDDPDCREAKIVSVTGFNGDCTGLLFVGLKPREQRTKSVDEIITRLRPKIRNIPGLIVSLVNPPVVNIGARLSTAQWQFTLQSTDLEDLYTYAPKLEERMRALPMLLDVKSDLQVRKPRVWVEVDRDRASALGLTLRQVQDAFYSAYGSRQVSTIYTATNFYYVILELDPRFRSSAEALQKIYVKPAGGAPVPLNTVATVREDVAPLTVSHSGQVPSATVFFNLKPGASISQAVDQIRQTALDVLPGTIQTAFQGTAQAFQSSLAGMGFLVCLTVIVIYMVLGILYESFIHPLTILTALPLAGFGALVSLWLFGMELDIYAMVGIILLVGIVKKNGIMMVDFALEAERLHELKPEESIYRACMDRFRPIMMTTLAALLGALPIALGYGAGGEARQPLGVCVVGGLVFSQFFTLYITPVFYIYLDRFSRWVSRVRRPRRPAPGVSS